MQISRRTALIFMLAGTACAASAYAQNDFPGGAVKIVAPFAAGGTADVLARTIATQLAQKYAPYPVVVENRPGMGGNIGAQSVARAKPDGLTLVLGTIGIHAAYGVYSKLGYDPAKELQPVAVLGGVPCVIVVHPSVPVRSYAEFVDYAKRNPGKLSFGSAGNGSSTHMVGELFQHQAGIQLTHVPYRGSASAMNDLMGAQIDAMFELVTTAAPFIRAGKIRALAVTSKERSATLPDVPTVSELGMKGFDATGWFTVATSAAVPKPIVARLNKDIAEVLGSPKLKDTWTSLGLTVMGGSPEEGQKFFASETRKWSEVIRAANIHAD